MSNPNAVPTNHNGQYKLVWYFFIYVMEAIKPGVMSFSHFQNIITFRKHNNCHTPGTEKVPQVQYQVSIIDCVHMWVWKESVRKVIHQHRYEALGGSPISGKS